MYCEFFGFTERPFSVTPNPRYLFLSKQHREAFAHLLYGIDRHAGFIELTGEVGTGKTTVLRTLLTQLADDTHRTALIFNPCLSPLELLHSINQEYGLPHEGLSKAELLDGLNAFLLEENRAGRTVVLVIDEAQNLEPESLEQVRLISNLETETDKLIQIVLAGQPELAALLRQERLRQLGQRITVRYHLLPMDYEDTKAYIDHRLEIAGGWRAASFSRGALKRIYRYAGGVPRLVNLACDRALLIGYTEERREITARMATAAIRELRESGRPLLTRRRLQAAGGIIGLVILLAAGVAFLKRPGKSGESAVHDLNAKNAQAAPDQPFRSMSSARQGENKPIRGVESAVKGVNALARRWQARPLPAGKRVTSMAEVERLVAKQGMRLTRFKGSVDTLLRADIPVLLELRLPGSGGTRYLAVTAMRDGEFLITPSLAGRSSLGREELASLWQGDGYLIWKNFQRIPTTIPMGSSKLEVLRLQILLIGAGFYDDEPSGMFDDVTLAALRKFQAARGLPQNGRPGAQALILLYRDGGHLPVPRLTGKTEGKRS